MHVIEEKKRFSKELTTVTPSAHLFKVVVNNYKQQKEERFEKALSPDDSTKPDESVGLPPQPARYLKYPEYDWL